MWDWAATKAARFECNHSDALLLEYWTLFHHAQYIQALNDKLP